MENDMILENLGDNVCSNFPLGKNELLKRERMLKYPSCFSK